MRHGRSARCRRRCAAASALTPLRVHSGSLAQSTDLVSRGSSRQPSRETFDTQFWVERRRLGDERFHSRMPGNPRPAAPPESDRRWCPPLTPVDRLQLSECCSLSTRDRLEDDLVSRDLDAKNSLEQCL